jgi:molybdate transport system substrate-binding protein
MGLVLLSSLMLTACRRQDESLMLFCGAGIRTAVTPILEEYEKQHGQKVSTTFAGSGHLLGQVASLQKGDLFMPGEEYYVEEAVQRGLADGATRKTVAYFIPVIFVQKGNPKQIHSLQDLTREGIRLGFGDERACAVGKQSVALFGKNGISPAALASNTVYKSGTVDELAVAIKLGQVDAVIVWDATAMNFQKDGDRIDIPAAANLPAAVSIVALRSSADPEKSRAFIRFMAGETARSIFEAKHYRTNFNP